MPMLQLSLLGPYQARLAGALVSQFSATKVQALLAYLAVEAHTSHARDTLIGLFWPEYPAESARQSLRQTLFRLRQAIPPAYFIVTNQSVQFNAAGDYSLDVTSFTELMTACHQHAHADISACAACCERMRQAVDLYRSDFLAGLFLNDSPAFEEWVLIKREWLRREALRALFHLAMYYEQQREYDQAYHYAWRQIELEPSREEAHQQLIRVLALSGRRSEARAQYLACRRILSDELGVQPGAATTALYEQIRSDTFWPAEHLQDREAAASGAPTSPATTAPTEQGAPAAIHNLPGLLSCFIGRDRETEEIKTLLAPVHRAGQAPGTDVRLITLTGAGGSGKTSLAVEAARRSEADFCRVHFVPLSAITEAESAAIAVAHALGLRHTEGRLLLEALREHVHLSIVEPALLVLDNVEQLAGIATVIAALLDASAALKILVTSRRRLRLAGEFNYRVDPLPVPKLHDRASVAMLAQNPAVTLFLQRGAAIDPSFTLDDDNRIAIAEICTRLDGLPLALELAAARIKLFTPQVLLTRLDRRLSVLTNAPRDLPERQQTLRNTIDWSYNLLNVAEQTLFRRLAVFVAGWTLEAAEAVCAGDGLDHYDVLDVLTQLVNKSLVLADREQGQETRYRLLETIRQYALERLAASGEADAVRRRHATFFLALVEASQPWLGRAPVVVFDLESIHPHALLCATKPRLRCLHQR